MPTRSAPRPTKPAYRQIDGNRFRLIETGEERLATLLELIEGARKSLRLLMYMFDDDACGIAVRDALVAAAARGVDVKVLVDGFGSAIPADFFEPLDSIGGDACVFNPRYGRKYLVRNHQKMVVADERKLIIGGSNIDETYLTDHGEKHWRDLWLLIEGHEAEPASRYFDALYRWSTRKRARLRSMRRAVGEFSEWRGALQWKFSGPASIRNAWLRSIARDCAKASRLDIIAAYFAPPGAVLRRIGDVGRRGKARVITAARSDNHTTIAAARHNYSALLRRGVEMYEYEPARLHTKLVIVDDVVYIGSGNFDYRSFYINMELMLRIRDSKFADSMRAYFELELDDCTRITPELHKRRSNPWRRLKWALSHFLVNIMDYTVTRSLNLRG